MPRFTLALREWNTADFAQTLKAEIEALARGALPLHLGVAQGGFVDDSDLNATVLSTSDAGSRIDTRVGVFFTEIVGGCSCGDEPMPSNAYCELLIRIDKQTAEADVSVIHD